MKLLGQPKSINVRKVLWTCDEIGLTPEREDWGGDTRSTADPSFLALNPKGLTPVLVDGARVLTESNTICRYLAARAGRRDLLPDEPAARAQVEAWMDWQATELNAAWRDAFMGLVRRDPRFSDTTRQTASASAWNRQMALLDARLQQTGAYVCGATFTLADIVLALSANRWALTPIEHAALPAVSDWMTRLSSRPGFVAHCRNGVA